MLFQNRFPVSSFEKAVYILNIYTATVQSQLQKCYSLGTFSIFRLRSGRTFAGILSRCFRTPSFPASNIFPQVRAPEPDIMDAVSERRRFRLQTSSPKFGPSAHKSSCPALHMPLTFGIISIPLRSRVACSFLRISASVTLLCTSSILFCI